MSSRVPNRFQNRNVRVSNMRQIIPKLLTTRAPPLFFTPSQTSPTMELITKSRNENESNKALVTLNQLHFNPKGFGTNDNSGETTLVSTAAPTPVPSAGNVAKKPTQKLSENFEEFTKRIMTTRSSAPEDPLELGPELIAALNSLSTASKKRLTPKQREKLLKRDKKPLKKDETSMERLDAEFEGRSVTSDDKNCSEFIEQEMKSLSLDTSKYLDNEKDESFYSSTFGSGAGRASHEETESFQQRNKLWKSALNSAILLDEEEQNVDNGRWERSPAYNNIFFKEPSFISSASIKKRIRDRTNFARKVTNQKRMRSSEWRKTYKKTDDGEKTSFDNLPKRSKAMIDLEKVLQKGSMLLLASSSLKPKSNKTRLRQSPMTYFPADATREKYFKQLPIYEKIQIKRESALGANNMPLIQENEKNEAKVGKSVGEKPFDGIQISSLVGNRVAALMSLQSKENDKNAQMSPLQLKLVQGLTDTQLSSFLENIGRRNPPLQILSQNEEKNSPLNHHQQHIENKRNEENYRALPQQVLTRLSSNLNNFKKSGGQYKRSEKILTGGHIGKIGMQNELRNNFIKGFLEQSQTHSQSQSIKK